MAASLVLRSGAIAHAAVGAATSAKAPILLRRFIVGPVLDFETVSNIVPPLVRALQIELSMDRIGFFYAPGERLISPRPVIDLAPCFSWACATISSDRKSTR